MSYNGTNRDVPEAAKSRPYHEICGNCGDTWGAHVGACCQFGQEPRIWITRSSAAPAQPVAPSRDATYQAAEAIVAMCDKRTTFGLTYAISCYLRHTFGDAAVSSPVPTPSAENEECCFCGAPDHGGECKPLVPAERPVPPVPPRMIDERISTADYELRQFMTAANLTSSQRKRLEEIRQRMIATEARASSPAVAPTEQVVCHKCGESFIFKRDGNRLLAFVRGHNCVAPAVAGRPTNWEENAEIAELVGRSPSSEDGLVAHIRDLRKPLEQHLNRVGKDDSLESLITQACNRIFHGDIRVGFCKAHLTKQGKPHAQTSECREWAQL